MRHIPLLILTLFLAAAHTYATNIATQIFNPAFRTLKIQNTDDFMAIPLIRMNTEDAITISFDEITDEASYLRYRLLHCNADWQPSSLLESEYLPAFNEGTITDFAPSSNTFIHYINYQIKIPNEEITPLLSGNYLLQVYPEFDNDNVILQARFNVSENIASITASASAKTDRGLNSDWQQLDITLDLDQLDISNPFADIILTIEQNNDPNTTRTLSHPQRLQDNKAIYAHMPELIFPAGNEFLRFETTQVVYPGLHADSLRFLERAYHAWLTPDHPRAHQSHQYDITQRGRFMIREFNATDSDLGADYIVTHFTLLTPPLSDYDIYLDGEFTHHLRTPIYRLEYDTDLRAYTTAIPLKQGSYNYKYIATPKSAPEITVTDIIDGNKHETINEYTIKAYYRPPGARADRLLGSTTIISQ